MTVTFSTTSARTAVHGGGTLSIKKHSPNSMWATFLGPVQPPTRVKVLLSYSEESVHFYIQDAPAKRQHTNAHEQLQQS